MKRLFAVLLCALLLCSFAFAESSSYKTDQLTRLANSISGLGSEDITMYCAYIDETDALVFTVTDTTIGRNDWAYYPSDLKDTHRTGVLTLTGQIVDAVKAFGFSETRVISIFRINDSSAQYIFIDGIDLAEYSH